MHDHANHIPIQKIYVLCYQKTTYILDLPLTRDAFISTTVWRLTFLSNREYIYSLYRLICHPDGPGWLETLEELERIVFEWILEEGQSQGTPVGGSEIWTVPSDVASKGSLYYGLYYFCFWQTYLLLHSINSTWLTLVKYWNNSPLIAWCCGCHGMFVFRDVLYDYTLICSLSSLIGFWNGRKIRCQ